MMRVVLATVAAVVVSAVAAPASANAGASWRDFALALGADSALPEVRRQLASYDLVVIDGQEGRTTTVRELRAGGTTVLGYLSVGTIEPSRPWYRSLRRYRLAGSTWGEPYARVGAAAYRRAMRRIAAGIAAKGFDGLFIDNVDVVESYPSQSEGMRRLLTTISADLRADSKLLFAQNSFPFLRANRRLLDGWNREDLSYTYSFSRHAYRPSSARAREQAARELAAMRALGLRTMATDYLPAAADAAPARQRACQLQALSFVSDILLRRLPAPYRCPG